MRQPVPARHASASEGVARSRAAWFTFCLLIVAVVGDGWSGRPGGTAHQLLVLPCTAAFLFGLWQLLFSRSRALPDGWAPRQAVLFCVLLEIVTLALLVYEAHHFAFLGYAIRGRLAWSLAGITILILLTLAARRGTPPWRLLLLFVATYCGGVLLAIVSFPLNYLRSDMLPVILWADTHLIQHVNPYTTMLVGSRVYDFPYLPGMLVAYLPFVSMHVDLRFASIVALSLVALIVFRAATVERRSDVVCVLGIFLLNPFLQYRHDLYLQPHWLTLVGAFVLMQRGRWIWGAFVLGLGMAIYQFSWIVLPFVLLNALWRRGWSEVLKQAGAAAAGALLLAGAFLHSAFARISNNTVGQWAHFAHALADPMNLSWWITCVLRPDKLLRLQACLLIGIFAFCVIRRRCTTLADTLRWTVIALTLFVLCNSIVDGYFFLMLLVPMMLFTLVANGWLSGPSEMRPEPVKL